MNKWLEGNSDQTKRIKIMGHEKMYDMIWMVSHC